jgi:hypothetical protein
MIFFEFGNKHTSNRYTRQLKSMVISHRSCPGMRVRMKDSDPGPCYGIGWFGRRETECRGSIIGCVQIRSLERSSSVEKSEEVKVIKRKQSHTATDPRSDVRRRRLKLNCSKSYVSSGIWVVYLLAGEEQGCWTNAESSFLSMLLRNKESTLKQIERQDGELFCFLKSPRSFFPRAANACYMPQGLLETRTLVLVGPGPRLNPSPDPRQPKWILARINHKT